jgi:hypothetical protein
VLIEILDEAGSSTTPLKKGAAQDININYIMWGHSQKVQLAGVATLAPGA